MKRERDIMQKREALREINEKYDFTDGTSRLSGRPVNADILEEVSIKHETLLTELGRAVPPRPCELKSDQDLWDVVGGETEETHEAFLFLLGLQDEVAREASAAMLIQMRRELQPPPDVDAYVKAVAELAARMRTRDTKFHAKESPRRTELLRLLERRSRWFLYRKLRLEIPGGRPPPARNFRSR